MPAYPPRSRPTDGREFIPAAVVLPRTAEQVSEIVKLANRRGYRWYRARGTGLNDGAVPLAGGIIVDVKRMNQIKEVDLVDRCVTVGPDQHDEAQRGARETRRLPPGHAGVVPVLAGRRPDRLSGFSLLGTRWGTPEIW